MTSSSPRCDGLHRGRHHCPAAAHSSTVTNCLGQLRLGGGCAETHLRGRRVGPAGRSAMRTAAGAAAVPPWTACCHSIKVFSSCVCAMVSVPARYVAPPAGEPSPRPAPCRKARGVQRVLGAGGARRGEQPRTERSSCHRADRRRSFSGRRNSSGAIGILPSPACSLFSAFLGQFSENFTSDARGGDSEPELAHTQRSRSG